MKYQTILTCLLITSLCNVTLFAQSSSEKTTVDKKINVYLLGTFHFAQTDETYNILDSKHQESILELCDIIKKQKPDKVFVERQPEYEFQNKIDSLYNVYVKENILRYKNEIYQVGFRVAKGLEHPKVYQCDHPGRYGSLYRASAEYAEANNQTDILNAKAKGTVRRVDNLIDEDSLQMNSSLLDYIRWFNSEEIMNSSHANYLTTHPQIGSTNFYDYDEDNTLIGAELVADWYRRNIMIYTKMINQLDYSEDAIFLIIGSDHVPIIKNLFEDNPFFEVVDPKEWLF